MERDLIRLERVLYEIVCDAGYAMVYCDGPEAASFCARQYEGVVRKLRALTPGVAYPNLPNQASAGTVRMAARSAAGLVHDQMRRRRRRGGHSVVNMLCTEFVHAMGWS